MCAVIPPLSLIGPVISIRRFGKKLLSTGDLLKNETPDARHARLSLSVAAWRGAAQHPDRARAGSGSGKTTMLNTLSRFIPEDERVITIEDTAELQLQQAHVVRLETRPMNIEGAGAISQRDLVINALRMRPDRIIVGECRGPEAFDMMQAMNTGHDGSMTTTHANSCRDAFSRVETMVMMASQNVPDVVIRHMLASAIHVVLHCARLIDFGTRKHHGDPAKWWEWKATRWICATSGCSSARASMSAGRVEGRFVAKGVKSHFSERLKAYSVRLACERLRRKAGVETEIAYVPAHRIPHFTGKRRCGRGLSTYVWSVPRQAEEDVLRSRLRELRVASGPRRRARGALMRREQKSSLGSLAGLLGWVAPVRRLQEYIHQANLKYRAPEVLALSVVIAVVMYLLFGALRSHVAAGSASAFLSASVRSRCSTSFGLAHAGCTNSKPPFPTPSISSIAP